MEIKTTNTQTGVLQNNTPKDSFSKAHNRNITKKSIHQKVISASSKSSSSVSEFLTLVSRLENRIANQSISDSELNQILGAIESKMNALSEKSRERMEQLDQYKKLKLEENKDFKKALKQMLKNDKKRELVFNLMKNSEFISIIRGVPTGPNIYSPI